MIAARGKHTELGRAGVWRGRSGGTAGLARSLLALPAIFLFVCFMVLVKHDHCWIRLLGSGVCTDVTAYVR